MTFDTTGLIGPQPQHATTLSVSLKTQNKSWDNSPTGTGKTYVALALARYVNRPFVVICPKLAIPQWRDLIKEWKLDHLCKLIINHEKLARGNTPHYKFIIPAAYRKLHNIPETVEVPEFLRAYFKFPAYWFVLVDECHKCRGVETLSAGLLFNLRRQNYTHHAMSATQATSPSDMRAFGFDMDLHDGTMKDFKRFQVEAGGEWVGKWGRIDFDSENTESMAKLEVVRNSLFNERKIGSRMKRSDFGNIFPPSQVVADALDMGAASDAIAAVYDEMQVELLMLEERCENYKEHILAIITKARRKAELLKIPCITEMVCDFKDEGRSTVVFLNYTDSIVALAERLRKELGKEAVGTIYGGQPVKLRLSDIADFQADKKIVTVANILAGGQSINLHNLLGKRSRSSLLNPSYSAVAVLQSAGRIDRAYAQGDVFQRFLLAARTIEEHVARRFHDRNRFITALNDGTLSDADLIPTDLLAGFARGITHLIK